MKDFDETTSERSAYSNRRFIMAMTNYLFTSESITEGLAPWKPET